MTYTWQAILEHVARKIGEAAETEVKAEDLVTPPNSDLGDVAFGCFKIAKTKGKNPAEIAKELAAKLLKDDHTIESVSASGPYLNVVLRTGDFLSRIIQEVEHYKAKYGSSEEGNGRQVMVEYAQPNTHKEMHIGHLRNLVLGASLARLLQTDGWQVIAASYHGDVGAHVSKCLWLLVRENSSGVAQPKPKKPKKGEPETVVLNPDQWTEKVLAELDDTMVDKIVESIPKEKRTGEYLGKIYAEASKLLEENPDWKEQVSEVQRKLEAKSAGWNKLWQETRRWSMVEMANHFRELGVTLDRQYYESEVVEEGQKIVDNLLKSGTAKESQGAIVVDLEHEKLGVFLIRKSDGTSLYATKDLALAQLKFKEYPKLERSLHVVDYRQSLYFKQLFRTLQLMGIKKPMEYVGYEFLTLKSGAMSSREGNVVTYESFRDEVLAFARKETAARHEDWPQGRVEHTAWCLAMGGIKYGMLKQDSEKIITFELEKALAFEGDTGPYIQYAVTRMNSILKKANWDATKGVEAGDRTLLTEKAEKKLALQLAVFPEICSRSAKELKPALIAQWCFTTAQAANAFYRDVPVLEAPFGVKQARLQLVASSASVLILGLNLLGIPVPEEM
ncbi:arginine--tRNA ligase [Candidatus Uhrbacteria bacterium]|nr:arginine--tRNA ligase [Candidatus Uhrbacteria bacterium]